MPARKRIASSGQRSALPLQMNSDQLYSRLKLRAQQSETQLRKHHPKASSFFDSVGMRPGNIRHHATKLLASGALAGSLLLASPHTALLNGNSGTAGNGFIGQEQLSPDQVKKQFAERIRAALPESGWQLTRKEEQSISQAVRDTFDIDARAELDGHRLNNSYGRMGAEQHLPRYPGDNVYEHGEFIEKGMTPGLGGWGYFAYSKAQMTPELTETEKYYVAVQTLYLPDWNTNTAALSKWYRYRHVLVVNPANGRTIVAAVADAGPSWWTGKHFGGSPEVLAYLGINTGMQNHPVVLFFLNDQDNKIPLGPLEYNGNMNTSQIAMK